MPSGSICPSFEKENDTNNKQITSSGFSTNPLLLKTVQQGKLTQKWFMKYFYVFSKSRQHLLL